MDVLLFLNGLLLSRLVYIFQDRPLRTPGLILLGVIQAMLCFIVFSSGWAALSLAILVVLVLLLSERWLPDNWMNETRFLGFVMVLLAGVVLRDNLSLAPWTETVLLQSIATLGFADGTVDSLGPGLWFLFGFLLVANETNLLIRSLFHRFHLEPRTPAANSAGTDQRGQIDQQEYNAGRVIGILERWLIYSVLMVSQNFNVIALIMAAKGFARFRQMEERAFAEYVLIGTLGSILLTVLIAQIISGLSGGYLID